MKCKVCGYEHEIDYYGKTTGDEEFIKIDCFGKPFETDKRKEYEYDNKKAYLYGCPKCNTVQFEFTY